MNTITCERRIYDDKLNTHAHAYGQLILPLHGSLYIETTCKKLMLENEQLFFLPPGCSHTFSADKSNEFLVLDISGNMLVEHDMENMVGGRELLFDDRWKAITSLLLKEADNEKSSSSINNLFFYAYHFISNNYVSPSINYINEHYAEDIELKKLADIEHYNTSYYSEWFKNNMKVSPIEYIQNLRVKRAKELLLHTNFTILQIAQMVGYHHNSSFTRVFKGLEKKTPVEFRGKTQK